MINRTSGAAAVAVSGAGGLLEPPHQATREALQEAVAWLAGAVLPLSVAVLVVASVAVVVGWQARETRCRRAWRGAARVEILAPPRVDPAGAVAFWRHLLGLLPPAWPPWSRLAGGHVVFEYEFSARGLSVSVWVPGVVPAAQVAAAARSAWPGSRTTITSLDRPAHGPHDGGSVSVGGRLRLARPARLPLATEHATDPLRAVIGAASPLGRRETVLVQVLARPVAGARLARIARPPGSGGPGGARGGSGAAGVLAGGLAMVAGVAATLVQEIVSTAVHGPAHSATRAARSRHPGAHPSQPSPRSRAAGPERLVDSAQDRATAAKAHGSGGGFTVAIRYLTTTTVPTSSSHPGTGSGAGIDGARVARAVSLRRARAVSAAFAVYSGHNHLRRRPLRRPTRTIERRQLRGGDALSVPELAALAHLPTDEHVPGLRRAGAAAIPPPPQIPAGGAGVRPLGDSDAVTGRPVGLAVTDARHHLWVLGATGAGKSTLCVHGILADARDGRGAIVLDPKGDLVGDILAHLPAPARARVILIDPDRPSHSGAWPCLNPLAPIGYAAASGAGVGDAAVENVVSVFARVFSAAWGHRSEDLFRVACLTLRDRPGTASLAQIPDLLGDDAVRARQTSTLHLGGRLARFWADFDQLPAGARAQIAAPLLNKLRAVLLRPFAERLLCGESTVDLPDVLDNGGLLLIRLPKGLLGEDTVRLIGSSLVAQVWSAALARAGQPEQHRRDASLLIDECHNFLHLPYKIEDLLAEARGFRLSLTLAHQHLGQLTPPLRDGIAANARNKVFFALSPEDATALARHTLPELGAHDLAHLDGFHAAARLVTGGASTRAFTLTTRPLPPAPPGPPPRPRTESRRSGSGPGHRGTPRGALPTRLDRFDPRLTARPTSTRHIPEPPPWRHPGRT